MNSEAIFWILGLVLIFAVLSSYPLWSALFFLGKMKKFPLTTIAKTPENEDVRVCGTLELLREHQPLVAPLSGRACAVWRVRVEELRSHGKHSRWEEVCDAWEAIPFALVDETGRATVGDTHCLTLKLDADHRGGTRLFDKKSPRLEEFCRVRGISMKGLIFNKSIRFQEGVLEEGELVTVVGSCRWESDPSMRGEGYRDVARVLRVGRMSTGDIMATDKAPAAKPSS